jgi:two-component system, chemotaxis family, response regulator Rcp1
MNSHPIEILLVEDSPSDTELTIETLRSAKLRNQLSVVDDGDEAMQFLRQEGRYANAPRPDLILLDLELPRKDGRELLAEIKADDNLFSIPVVVLTASVGEEHMLRAQELRADSYITKPVELARFFEAVRELESFCVLVVTLPPAPPVGDAVSSGGGGQGGACHPSH